MIDVVMVIQRDGAPIALTSLGVVLLSYILRSMMPLGVNFVGSISILDRLTFRAMRFDPSLDQLCMTLFSALIVFPLPIKVSLFSSAIVLLCNEAMAGFAVGIPSIGAVFVSVEKLRSKGQRLLTLGTTFFRGIHSASLSLHHNRLSADGVICRRFNRVATPDLADISIIP